MIDTLLSSLQKVRPISRDSWIACCPAHNDRSPSLSIRHTSNGQILIHCFAGCSTDQVLDAIGLSITDLFPQAEHENLPPLRHKFSAMAVLQLVRQEAMIVGLAAIDLKNGKPLSEVDRERLITAIGRIQEAVNYAS